MSQSNALLAPRCCPYDADLSASRRVNAINTISWSWNWSWLQAPHLTWPCFHVLLCSETFARESRPAGWQVAPQRSVHLEHTQLQVATRSKRNLSELNEKLSNCGCYKLNAVHKAGESRSGLEVDFK